MTDEKGGFSGLPEQCTRTHQAYEVVARLPESQSGEGRHKCASCAYERGMITGAGERKRFDTVEDIEAFFGEEISRVIGRTVGLRSVTRNYANCILVGFRELTPMGWVAVVRYSRNIERRALNIEVIDQAIDNLDFRDGGTAR